MKNELSRKIYNTKTIKKMEKRIKLLGVSSKMDAITFLNLRLFTSIILFFITIYIFNLGYVLGPIINIIYYYLCSYLLISKPIKKRTSKLEKEAMHFFEVLTLSLETGKNLNEAFIVTVNTVDNELSNQFKEALREVKYGKSLTEALVSIQQNIPSETINNTILTLTQADVFGNSVVDTMYNQIDYLREKRKLEVKASISKVPIKISVISVLFFVPLILLLILSPILISYLK